MKRFLVFAAAAATMFSSCTKQYVDEVGQTGGSTTVGFNTHVAASVKGVAKTGFVMGDQFFVYGGKTGAANFVIETPNNGEWAYTGPNFPKLGATVSNYGDDVWRYDNPVPWNGSKITFFAFSPVPDPKADGEQYGIEMPEPAVNTIPTIDFEVKGGYPASDAITSESANKARAENKKQVDLLWAFAADKSSVDRSVALDFNHALTQINFSIKSKAPVGHMIRINTIAVKNVATTATLALAHNENADPKPGSLAYLGGWTAHAGVKSFPVNLKNSVAALIKDNGTHAINDGDEALMMIPQSLQNVELEVCYAYSADGIAWEEYKNGVAVTVKLGEFNTHTHWNPNKAIRYVINITPGDVISFTAKVEDWGQQGEIEIIHANPGQNATMLQDIPVQAGDSISVRNGGWITYSDGNEVKLLTTTPVVAPANCKFAVLANIIPAIREDQIIVQKADGVSQTIVKVAQAAGSGIFEVAATASDIEILNVKAGDVVSIPVTKAAATWVKYKVGEGAPVEFSAPYTVVADGEKLSFVVEENAGAARAAAVTYTPKDGTAFVYTIKQAGVATPELPLDYKAVAGEVLTGADKDVITLTDGGGDWLTITDTDGEAKLADMTANGAYSIKVKVNTTTAARTAKFTVVSEAGVTKKYVLTQAAATTEALAIGVDGTPSGTLGLVEGDTILKNTTGSPWLKLESHDASVIVDFSIDQAVSDVTAGEWVLKAAENATGAELSETFTVTSADGGVKVYTVTQAEV